LSSLRAEGVTEPDFLSRLAPHRQGHTGGTRVSRGTDAATDPGVASVPRVPPAPARPDPRRDVRPDCSRGGCSPRTVELIRNQDAPLDPEFGELLRLADEAN
jgi:hypothetical protein